MQIKLYYDKECPFCKKYAQILKLKQNHEVNILNARENQKDILFFKEKGFDINEGFIIFIEEKEILQGSEAVIFLDKLSEKKLFLVDTWLFKKIAYPIIKLVRKAILLILGKNPNIKF